MWLVLLKRSRGESCAEPIAAADGGEVLKSEVGLCPLGELDAATTLGHPVNRRALTKTQYVATSKERSHVINRFHERGVNLHSLDEKH